MDITEIFHSIQGESTHAGRPCVFVRLAGCNLRCRWCDTPYSWEPGQAMSVAGVLARVEAFGCPLVELTGGEPLLQPETPGLALALLGRGYEVLVETNGSLPVAALDPRAAAIVDVKCPSSGMRDATHWPNIEGLRGRDEVKFVVADREDFDYAASVVRRYGLGARPVHFSPASCGPGGDRLAPAELAAWILESRLPVRLGLQLHKYIWDPEMRGV